MNDITLSQIVTLFHNLALSFSLELKAYKISLDF